MQIGVVATTSGQVMKRVKGGLVENFRIGLHGEVFFYWFLRDKKTAALALIFVIALFVENKKKSV